MTFLIVDDNPDMRETLKRMVAHDGDVVFDCADNIGDPETCGRELRPIGNHFEGSYEPTQGIHVRDARDGAQGRPDGPIEQAAAFLQAARSRRTTRDRATGRHPC